MHQGSTITAKITFFPKTVKLGCCGIFVFKGNILLANKILLVTRMPVLENIFIKYFISRIMLGRKHSKKEVKIHVHKGRRGKKLFVKERVFPKPS